MVWRKAHSEMRLNSDRLHGHFFSAYTQLTFPCKIWLSQRHCSYGILKWHRSPIWEIMLTFTLSYYFVIYLSCFLTALHATPFLISQEFSDELSWVLWLLLCLGKGDKAHCSLLKFHNQEVTKLGSDPCHLVQRLHPSLKRPDWSWRMDKGLYPPYKNLVTSRFLSSSLKAWGLIRKYKSSPPLSVWSRKKQVSVSLLKWDSRTISYHSLWVSGQRK